MFKKSVLAELIDEAVESCYTSGEGRMDDDYDLGLKVTAEWVPCEDPEYGTVILICIFQNGVLKFSYEDPETKCN